MEQFEIGKEYHFDMIEKAQTEDIVFIEHDFDFVIGQAICFLINDNKNQAATFVMTSYNTTSGAYYKCVYNDLQNPVS